jgi:hypothetical protein
VQLSYYFTQRFADESVDLKVREREKEGRGERERERGGDGGGERGREWERERRERDGGSKEGWRERRGEGGQMEKEKERSEGQERFISYSHLPPPSLRPECFPFNAGQEHLHKKDLGLSFGSYSVFDTQVKAN